MNDCLDKILKNLLVKNDEFEDYVNNRCINALNKFEKYIDREFPGNYSEDELTVMRENYLFKAGLYSGIQILYNLNKLNKN